MQADFADLLDQHMRRIRASASAVAIEIGMSREAVNNWRRGYSKPSKKHRNKVLACSNYLRLSELECNRLLSSVGFNDEFAYYEKNQAVNYVNLFEKLEQAKPYPILLVLSQAHIDQPPQKQVILEMAKSKYPTNKVLHIQMPYAEKIKMSQFFQFIGAQLSLNGVENELSFEFKLSDLLQQHNITLLITRFEHGNQECREMLAGILRNLCEMYTGKLQLILCGGEGLSALKYAQGNLSLLNIAISHLLEFNLKSWINTQNNADDNPENSQHFNRLSSLIGDHPALASSLYQGINNHLDQQQLIELIDNNDMLYCDFNQALQASSIAKLKYHLDQTNLGNYRPHLQDETLRKLFWLNLIKKENNQLVWHSESIRQFGINLMSELAK